MRCAAITKAGERCQLDATSGSYCWSHAPENAQARKQRGRRGGKARGASELSEVKREIRTVVLDVLEGRVERGIGAVVFQGYNTLLKAVEIERKVKETEELEERIEQLEQSQEQRGDKRWGA
ncbi:MAG: hypothetical protein LC781_09695 [Actinobacteria bacterium]|nr:hypothetical protein [Actinomycetota bacterium]